MSNDRQAGCFSFSSLFRSHRRRHASSASATAAASSSRPTSTHTYSPTESFDKLEKQAHDHGHRFGSCCSFAAPQVASPDLWTRQTNTPPPVYAGEDRKENDNVYRPEVLSTIEETMKRLDSKLRELSLDIHSHPEIMFKEEYAHDVLTKFMSDHGFEVEKHYTLPTAWRATFEHGKGGRTIGVNSEMDALPGIGHACGHNLIAISGVGMALAIRDAIVKHDIPGKIVLLGTPAEEGGQGKAIMIDKGAYKGMDACLMCHPGPGPAHTAALGSCLAMQGLEVEFFGHTSHASAAPWEGTNALDAAFLSYSNVSALRQQIKPDHRVHGVIKGPNDLAANVIPDYTKMLWYVRAPTYAELEVLRARVLNCFEAAALATGCKHKVEIGRAAMDLRQNSVLSDEFASILKHRYRRHTTQGEGAIGGSTDFGNVTYVVPGIHPAYAIPTEPNGGNHTPAFTAAAATQEAHDATLVMTQALALAGFRILDDEDYCKRVRKAYEEEVLNSA